VLVVVVDVLKTAQAALVDQVVVAVVGLLTQLMPEMVAQTPVGPVAATEIPQ
jgi:hypothetical protein